MQTEPVVISGTAGIGKTTLVCQLIGTAKRQKQLTFLLPVDCLLWAENAEDMNEAILSEARRDDFQASSNDDLVALLKEKEAILLIDELKLAFEEEQIKKECEPLAQLIERAAAQKIPLALVIHQDPELFAAAQERFPFISEKSPIIIPRDLTREEIRTIMLSGAFCEPGQEPKQPDVLTIEDDAIDALIHLTGYKPISVITFIESLYQEQKDS